MTFTEIVGFDAFASSSASSIVIGTSSEELSSCQCDVGGLLCEVEWFGEQWSKRQYEYKCECGCQYECERLGIPFVFLSINELSRVDRRKFHALLSSHLKRLESWMKIHYWRHWLHLGGISLNHVLRWQIVISRTLIWEAETILLSFEEWVLFRDLKRHLITNPSSVRQFGKKLTDSFCDFGSSNLTSVDGSYRGAFVRQAGWWLWIWLVIDSKRNVQQSIAAVALIIRFQKSDKWYVIHVGDSISCLISLFPVSFDLEQLNIETILFFHFGLSTNIVLNTPLNLFLPLKPSSNRSTRNWQGARNCVRHSRSKS